MVCLNEGRIVFYLFLMFFVVGCASDSSETVRTDQETDTIVVDTDAVGPEDVTPEPEDPSEADESTPDPGIPVDEPPVVVPNPDTAVTDSRPDRRDRPGSVIGQPQTPTQPPPSQDISCENTNGMFLPSIGRINTLVLFIRYRDENHSNQYWPADGFPRDWQQFIDESPSDRRTNFHNLTHFYREASGGKFTIVGRVDTVTAELSIENPLDYGTSNRTVLKQVEGRYDNQLGEWLDNWTKSEHCHENASDGNIDLILMIWRSNRFSNTSLNWSGIAHIGGGRIEPYTFLGKDVLQPVFPRNFSSGATVATRDRSVQDGLLTADAVFKTTVHEIAHQQITFWHPQAGSQGMQRFPSMLAYSEQEIHTHSGREADMLGWGTLTTVTSDTVITLGDFYETGSSVLVKTGGSSYLIENRQKTSIYDDASVNPDDKGLFVYEYSARNDRTLSYDGTNSNIIPLPSDGFYDWEFSGKWLPGWRAIFDRKEANAAEESGFTRKQVTSPGTHHWISTMVEDGEQTTKNFRGVDLHASFSMERPRLNSDTNPSVDDIRLEVLSVNGRQITFSVKINR